MTWYEDLLECDYVPAPGASKFFRAIGWLDRDHSFTTGKVPREVFDRLKLLLAKPWQTIAFGGVHDCNLCSFHAEAMGHKNLFVPGAGFMYVCPELILHYMNAHQYSPPNEFCDAVMQCPNCDSMEYRKLVLANGGSSLMNVVGNPMVPPT
jgi:hypothetical protein